MPWYAYLGIALGWILAALFLGILLGHLIAEMKRRNRDPG